jgi:hypothetical protein
MNSFIRVQNAKQLILDAAEQLDSQGIRALEVVEGQLADFLRGRAAIADNALSLADVDRVINYLEDVQNEFRTGVKELDDAHIIPMRRKLYFVLAPSGYGKTWALIQIGKMAFVLKKKVLHISMEIEAEEVAQRYYQALFAASKRDDIVELPRLKRDNKDQIKGVERKEVTLDFTFSSSAIREELQTRVKHFGKRIDNIKVKDFPMRGLSVEQLDAYLEQIDAVHGFKPDMLIIDYPGIMKTDAKNHRISLGRLIEDLRGLAKRRDLAIVAAHQTSKEGMNAEMVRATHVAEDFSAVMTADFLVTYSQSAAEQRYGLARLYVAKGRSEQDKFGVIITQNYKTGQFVLDSARLSDNYTKLMERIKTRDDAAADEESGGEDE